SLVLKLYYTPNATTLTYKANGGEGSDIVDAGVVDEKLIVRSGIVFTRTGYTFAGWNTKADGSGTLYEADNVYTLTVDEDVLYAQWEEVLEEETLPPTSPTSPQNPNQPQTGDTVNLLSWLIVMVISALAMISILFYFRKKNK
ncbi:MAG: InlB B-repeat-containing protein, partial [Firmicutes bacterium]|nr:InlB B-repeat-containing protein [Bacillota bacterium]